MNSSGRIYLSVRDVVCRTEIEFKFWDSSEPLEIVSNEGDLKERFDSRYKSTKSNVTRDGAPFGTMSTSLSNNLKSSTSHKCINVNL